MQVHGNENWLGLVIKNDLDWPSGLFALHKTPVNTDYPTR